MGDAWFCINHKLTASIAHCLTGPTATALFIKIYHLLQLQFKTHSVLLRLAAQGRASRFFWQLRSAATGAASASNRATTPWMTPTKDYIYSQRKGYRRKCGGWRGGGVNLASSTAGQQPREPVAATRNKPTVGPASARARNRTAATVAR